jgi:protein-S-isoprenylcysteine O-methyltransferase Ste14
MMKLCIASLFLFCGTSVHSFTPSTTRLAQAFCKTNRDVVTVRRMSSDGSSDEPFAMPDLSGISEKVSKMDVGQVVANLQSGGEVGQRGEVYAIGQAVLIFFILIGGVPVLGGPLRIVAGPSLLLGGVALVLLSLVDLGSDSLTPFLTPTDEGSLKKEGIYASMRHPLYTGLISLMGGLSILSNSADRLLLTVALCALIDVKASKEEEYLKEKFPNYEAYMVSDRASEMK